MAQDMEERLRQSLAARVGDVEPDPATWETVQSRVRRRAYARWTATGAVAVAALVLAALVLPGLLTGTRVDLTPAEPPDGEISLSGAGLVATDGRTMTVSDASGAELRTVNPPPNTAEPLPIARLAVRPGSTPDDLTMVFIRADTACERTDIEWVWEGQPGPTGSSPGPDGISDALGGGPGSCATAPVWSPDGGTVAWIEQQSADGRDTFALHLRGWGDEGSHGPADGRARHDLATPELTALRATGWHAEESAAGATAGIIALSGRRADGTVQAFTLPVAHDADGDLELGTTLEPAEPHRDAAVRSAMLAVAHRGSGPAWGYDLGVDREGIVVLSQLADAVEPLRLRLDPEVVTPEDIDSGDAWLSAGEDAVVFGVTGDAWTVRLQDAPGGPTWGAPQRIAGTVVHAVPIGDGRPSGESDEPAGEVPEPTQPGPPTLEPSAVELSALVTDGAAITLNGPEGTERLVTAVDGDITDVAVHPTSTADDLTVVWREGSGCDATVHWARIFEGSEVASGTPPATCPGRPVFAPDGNHLAWISQGDVAGAGQASFVLESLPWWTGPYSEIQTFTLRAHPAETIALDLLDWVWTEGTGPQTAGVLHLRGSDSHGTLSAYTAPIGRHDDDHPADPQLELPEGATAEQVSPFVLGTGQERFALLRVDSHHDDGAAVGPEYTLEQRVRDDGRDLVLVRDGDGDQSDSVTLPEGLLEVNTTGEVDDVWMTARGDDVLLGDGAGRAWWLAWSAGGWSAVRELEGAVRYALPFAPPDQDDGPPVQ